MRSICKYVSHILMVKGKVHSFPEHLFTIILYLRFALCTVLVHVYTLYYRILQFNSSSLTGRVVIDIVVALGAIDPQKHLVVVVLIPVEGQDPGAASLWVPAEEAGHAGHQLGE